MREGGSTVSGGTYKPSFQPNNSYNNVDLTASKKIGEFTNSLIYSAAGAAIQGGDVKGAVTGVLKNEILNNLGPAGKVISAAMNLFSNDRANSLLRQSGVNKTADMGKNLIAQKKAVFTGNIEAAKQMVQQGQMTIEEFANNIKDAVENTKNNNAAGEGLIAQRQELEQKNQEIAQKIQELGGKINITNKDGKQEVTITDANGNQINGDTKNNNSNNSDTSALNELISQYMANFSMIEALNIQITNIATNQTSIGDVVGENQEKIDESKQELEEEVETNVSQIISDTKADLDTGLAALNAALGGDKNIANIQKVVDKTMAGAQTAYSVANAFWNPEQAAEAAKNAVQNLAAVEINKVTEELVGIKMGDVLTGKVDVEQFVTDQAIETINGGLKDVLERVGADERAVDLLGDVVSDKIRNEVEAAAKAENT